MYCSYGYGKGLNERGRFIWQRIRNPNQLRLVNIGVFRHSAVKIDACEAQCLADVGAAAAAGNTVATMTPTNSCPGINGPLALG